VSIQVIIGTRLTQRAYKWVPCLLSPSSSHPSRPRTLSFTLFLSLPYIVEADLVVAAIHVWHLSGGCVL
jgi:hypothetical protein